jgi:hypothetical protein
MQSYEFPTIIQPCFWLTADLAPTHCPRVLLFRHAFSRRPSPLCFSFEVLTRGFPDEKIPRMALSLGDRLGIAGLIMALLGIAAAYIWPDKKWIGWVCLFLAAGLFLFWGVAELKQQVRGATASLVISICIGCIVGGGVAAILWFSSPPREPESAPISKPAAPSITWPTPAPITAGTPLSDKQLNAKASTEGLPTYSPDIGTILPVGRHPLMVTFHPIDTKKYDMANMTVYLVVNPAPPIVHPEAEPTKPPVATTPSKLPGTEGVAPQDNEAFKTERPILVVLPKTLSAPLISLTKGPASTFQIGVVNRGRHFARSAVLSAKMMFPGRQGMNSPKEMRAVCEHPSLYTVSDGPSVAPDNPDPETLQAGAVTDLEGLENELLDPNNPLWGFLVGCVTYHSDLNEQTLHTAFTFRIATTLSIQQLRELKEHASPFAFIPYDKVVYTPDQFSPYDY